MKAIQNCHVCGKELADKEVYQRVVGSSGRAWCGGNSWKNPDTVWCSDCAFIGTAGKDMTTKAIRAELKAVRVKIANTIQCYGNGYLSYCESLVIRKGELIEALESAEECGYTSVVVGGSL
jgi:hypothetical protein